MEYRSKEDLEGNVLALDDTVIFTFEGVVYEYLVYTYYLNKDGYDNGIIFSKLGKDKYSLASQYYGYEVCSGSWPEFSKEDYRAVTRLVIALYEEIEKQESKPKKMTKTQRIEALELQVAELTKLITPTELAPECGISDTPKFDPENPTEEGLPEVWLAKLTTSGVVAIDFVSIKDESSSPFRSVQHLWFDRAETTLLPYSQWPKLLIDHYNEYREETGLPNLPTF